MFAEMEFDDWYDAVKHKLPHMLKVELNPTYGRFYYYDGAYFQLCILPEDPTQIIVMMACGRGFEWMRLLGKWAKMNNLSWITMSTSQNNDIIQKLAKYWGFELTDVKKQYYQDGSDLLFYQLNVKNSKRLNTSN